VEPSDARHVLEALVQGLDPASGAELAAGTVLQRPEVVGALLAGIAALEADAVRRRRRALIPENVGRPWSGAEEERLVAAFRAGNDLGQIADRHRRTLAGIEARLQRLGLLTPEQRMTRNRYVSREPARPAPVVSMQVLHRTNPTS